MAERGRLGGVSNGAKRRKAAAKLEALNVDPLELSANFAMGIGLDEPHPAAGPLNIIIAALERKVKRGTKVTALDVKKLKGVVSEFLQDGYIKPEIRSKHIMDLMQYVHPKLRSVEHTGTVTYNKADEISDDILLGIINGTVDPTTLGNLLDDITSETAGAAGSSSKH